MTGGGLLELILVSMGWLFFLAGLAANYPGVAGSITVFFTIGGLVLLLVRK